MRILVVEDEQDLNRILAKTLKAEGYSVDSCFDGVEALDYLKGAEYDAVVLDVMMPRMDGFSVLAQMRADGNETPVLFLTAKDSVPDRVHGLDSGADDYLVKPFSFDELLARLRVITRKHGGSATNVQNYSIAINLRLPRILMAIIVGAGLTCAGNTFQSLFSNPLATPDILGVTLSLIHI